ncbi:MAG: flagellar hook capping FlgD N-terminal domain-containing protein [Pseudomonadota bacterium]|jgi:flagellar basal-body rod modification protein FlgD|nr:flagellar hook capping FlgD N-terminal domain-containing protein [Pseudomonadota bacterium]
MDFSTLNVNSSSSSSSGTTGTASADDAGSQDRFLKLLITQMQNQDPLNPMDNAQVTTQIAQINTVKGIETLNTSVGGLSSQFTQMQALQGASLVGRDVVVAGNVLDITDGVGQGGFELSGAADAVKVEVLSPAGQVVDTIALGAMGSGMHSFDWPTTTATNDSGLHFRVTASNGTVTSTPTTLMRDRVNAITTSGNTLNLELQNSGSVPYSSVKALN